MRRLCIFDRGAASVTLDDPFIQYREGQARRDHLPHFPGAEAEDRRHNEGHSLSMPHKMPKFGILQRGERVISPAPEQPSFVPRPTSCQSPRSPLDSHNPQGIDPSGVFVTVTRLQVQAQQALEYEKARENKPAQATVLAPAPRSPRAQTKLRATEPTDASPALRIQDDLDYEGYTSTDSYSNERVMQLDWRVLQVKTASVSTNTVATQYWHWVDRAESSRDNNLFEHQVLKDSLPSNVMWGVYKEPLDFHLRLSELVQVLYAPESTKVIIGTRQIEGVEHRGDVLAHFRRERTKRRFLSFMREKGIKIVMVVRYVSSNCPVGGARIARG